MTTYIISGILIIIAFIIIALILRKRVYDRVDHLESWKMDIMNRNIASQLAQIKNLNLSGETQQKFETWKNRWEQIVAKELSEVEEHLFETEDAADHYRFPTANKTMRIIEGLLTTIEEDLEQMLNELDHLLTAEKHSRKEVFDLSEEIGTLRTSISQRRYQYGRADSYFEVELDELEEQLLAYDEFVQSGEYTKASEHVSHIREKLQELVHVIDQFPQLYKKCKDELPSQFDELLSGIKEMINDGFRIKHLNLQKEIQTYQQRLIDCVESLEQGETEHVVQTVPEIEDRIHEMYQILEQEAIAKNYIEIQVPNFKQTMTDLEEAFEDTKAEVEQLKTTYYFEDEYMEKYLTLEKSVAQLNSHLQELTTELSKENMSHSDLRDFVESGFKQLEELQEEHDNFKIRIQNLRKDELAAKEKLTEMHEQLNLISRKLQKSNLPGVPNFIWDIVESAHQKMEEVIKSLNKQPLDISNIQHGLNEAKVAVEHAVKQTDIILDQAFLTEQVIQYANRYRSQYPLLAAKLAESERLFRSYEYELALEHAAKAIEEIEPGALKRIEENQRSVEFIQ